MIRIRTNIEQVQQRLRRLEVELHKALLRALDIKEWRNTLSVSAEKILKKQWQMERDVELRAFYERLTPRIVETVMGDLYDIAA